MKDISSLLRSTQAELDVRQRTDRTVARLLSELQIGSLLHGKVSEVTKSGYIIFTTSNGKFSIYAPEIQAQKDDFLTVKIISNAKGKMICIPTVFNQIKLENTRFAKQVSLVYFAPMADVDKAQEHVSSIKVDIDLTQYDPNQNLKGKINYINIDHLSKNKKLLEILQYAQKGSPIEMKIVPNKVILPSRISAIVIEDKDPEIQLIKADFGIISVKKGVLQIGQKLSLEITSLNNKDVITPNIKQKVEDFLFKININTMKIKNIEKLVGSLSTDAVVEDIAILQKDLDINPYSVKISEDSKTQKVRFESSYIKGIAQEVTEQKLRNIVTSSVPQEERQLMNDLSNDLKNIKELISFSYANNDDYNKWHILFIPTFDGEKTRSNKMFVRKQKDNITRFMIEISEEWCGTIQVDGLITMDQYNEAETLDIVIRSKKLIEQKTQRDLSDIFFLSRNLYGLGGSISFAKEENFVDYRDL